MYSIYVITNSVNGKKYVGKTCFSVEKRFKEHLSDYRKRSNEKRPLYYAMKKYGTDKFSVEKIEECTNLLAEEREKYWISKLDTFKNGYNATVGGDGKSYIDEDEIVKLYEELHTLVSVSETTGHDVGYISKILKRNGISVCFHPYKSGVIQKPKKITQYTCSGEYVRTFDSVSEACKQLFEDGVTKNTHSGVRGHIADNANGKTKSAYGFVWKYE